MFTLILFTLLTFNRMAYAQITLDGTLGPAKTLTGPDYQVTATLGQQHGNNLFHSFRDFNLESHESVTFSGPAHINQLINRVTGGMPSHINGLLRSTLPHAAVYLVNPAGIFFGEQAQLDVAGAFHASTADTVYLQKGGQFNARYPTESLLTVDPVESFGFLTQAPAPITVKHSYLSVAQGQILALIGGDLHIQGQSIQFEKTYFETAEGSIFVPLTEQAAILSARAGQVHLVSVDGPGKVKVAPTATTSPLPSGDIRAENTFINVSGDQGGRIFIQAGSFKLDRGALSGKTGQKNGAQLTIQAHDIQLKNGAIIDYSSQGAGKAGDIQLKAQTFTLDGVKAEKFSSHIFNAALDKGHAGNIEITADHITLVNARIRNDSFSTGNSGAIHIKANTLTAKGYATASRGGILSNASSLRADGGDAGQIRVEAQDIQLTDLSLIASGTFGGGQAGTVFITAEKLSISGKMADRTPSAILSDSLSTESYAGSAGEIVIRAHTVKLEDGGKIGTLTNNASGGDITVLVDGMLYLREGQITTSVQGGSGNGGNITIKRPTFVILNAGQIIAQADEGQGGDIRLAAEQFLSSQDSLINASSNLGIDGQVMIASPNEANHAGLIVLPSTLIDADASALLKKSCNTYTEKPSRFLFTPLSGSSLSPIDLNPSSLQ